MAFDGFTIAALVSEMDAKLTGGHIQKIAQPEADELLLSIKNNTYIEQARLGGAIADFSESFSPADSFDKFTKTFAIYSAGILYAVKKTFRWSKNSVI